LNSPAIAGEQRSKREMRRQEWKNFMAFPYRLGWRRSKKEGRFPRRNNGRRPGFQIIWQCVFSRERTVFTGWKETLSRDR